MGIFDIFFEDLEQQNYNYNLQFAVMTVGILCLAAAFIARKLVKPHKQGRVQEPQRAEAQAIEASPPVQGQINTELGGFITEQYLKEDGWKMGPPNSNPV